MRSYEAVSPKERKIFSKSFENDEKHRSVRIPKYISGMQLVKNGRGTTVVLDILVKANDRSKISKEYVCVMYAYLDECNWSLNFLTSISRMQFCGERRGIASAKEASLFHAVG